MATDAPSSQTRPRDAFVERAIVVALSLFAAAAFVALQAVPFPSAYDEWEHYSFIASMREAPTFFPAYGSYRTLVRDGVADSGIINYIAHPPLYYWLMGLLSDDVMVLRGVNLCLGLGGFAMALFAGVRFAGDRIASLAFIAAMLVFSKPMLIAGMINNDNLVLLETGLLMLAMSDEKRKTWLVALVLAAAGWTKFNAFVGLAMIVGVVHGLEILGGMHCRKRPLSRTREARSGIPTNAFAGPRIGFQPSGEAASSLDPGAHLRKGHASLFIRESSMLIAGIVIGALPTIGNLVLLGSPVYIAVEFLWVSPDQRPVWNFGAFALAFFHKVGIKIFYEDDLVNLLPLAIAMLAIAVVGIATARRNTRAFDIACAALISMAVFIVLHIAYGWKSFQTLGSMSDAQSRYYLMLWPFVSVAFACGLRNIASRLRKQPDPAVSLRN